MTEYQTNELIRSCLFTLCSPNESSFQTPKYDMQQKALGSTEYAADLLDVPWANRNLAGCKPPFSSSDTEIDANIYSTVGTVMCDSTGIS